MSNFPTIKPILITRPLGPVGATFALDVASQQYKDIGGCPTISVWIQVVGNSAVAAVVDVELVWYLEPGTPLVGRYEQMRRRNNTNTGILDQDIVSLPGVTNAAPRFFSLSAANPAAAKACLVRFRSVASVVPNVECRIGAWSA
jgi:hypothetical protein